jgi:hypothetical protein
MGYVPIPQPPAQTTTSRELEKLIEKTVNDFRRTHAKVTDDEIRSALTHAMPSTGAEAKAREHLIAGIIVAGIVTAVGLVIGVVMAAESKRGALVIAGLVTACALAGLGVAALRTYER